MSEPITSFSGASSFDPEVLKILGHALDQAWQTVTKSGSPMSVDGHAPITREMLAKAIIANASRGERNLRRLVDAALTEIAGRSV
jgi:hypothetical protein